MAQEQEREEQTTATSNTSSQSVPNSPQLASADGPAAAKKRKPNSKPIAKACNECARRKARCSGGVPCASCLKTNSTCTYSPAQRRGPKVRKNKDKNDASQSNTATNGNGADGAAEDALNMLADLSRPNTTNGTGSGGGDGLNDNTSTSNGISLENITLNFDIPVSSLYMGQETVPQSGGAGSSISARELPREEVEQLPPLPRPEASAGGSDNAFLQTLSLPFPMPARTQQQQSQRPSLQQTQSQPQPRASTQGFSSIEQALYGQIARQDEANGSTSNSSAHNISSLILQDYAGYQTASTSANGYSHMPQSNGQPAGHPYPTLSSAYSGASTSQLQPQGHQHHQSQPNVTLPGLQSYSNMNGQEPQAVHSRAATHPVLQQQQQQSQYQHTLPPPHPLPGVPHADSPSGSESAFAQSFYKADGPGLNHFQTVLSREFNVRDGDSPSNATTGQGNAQSHNLSFSRSAAHVNGPGSGSTFAGMHNGTAPHSSVSPEMFGFSPANSEVPLPPHMERDLVQLADTLATQQTLFALYWCYVHVQWPIIYRPAFGFEQAQKSPALFNAMLSVTCRYDVSRQLQHVPGTLKNLPLTSRLGEIYTKRAIAHLDMNEMVSSVHKVQALFMLALRDVAQGFTSRGWMYAGMSIRMAYDLQLHQPSKVYKHTALTPITQQEERRTMWCCYTLDRSMSLFLGRPPMINSCDIETPLPSHWEADEFSYWAEDAKAVIPDRLAHFVGVQAKPVSTLVAWIKLCKVLERTMSLVYKPKGGPARPPDSAATELNNALDQWQDEHSDIFKRAEELPRATTNLFLLLLFYHTTRLILNRPFIPNNQLISTFKGEKPAYTYCTDAADAIVSIVSTLEQIHGIFRCSYVVLFTIFQAGVMHCLVSSTARDPLVTTKAIESLRQCDVWLESMAETYKCGIQYRHVLSAMERLSKRELRDSVQVTEILASRRGSRQATPTYSDHAAEQSLLPADGMGNPLSSLHYSFWDMPLHIPLQNNDLDSWISWERDYGSLLLDLNDGLHGDGLNS